MDTKSEAGNAKFVERHLSQLKVLARVIEHEIDSANGREVTMDRSLVESILDTLEIFIEDVQGGTGRDSRAKSATKEPAVTRLN